MNKITEKFCLKWEKSQKNEIKIISESVFTYKKRMLNYINYEIIEEELRKIFDLKEDFYEYNIYFLFQNKTWRAWSESYLKMIQHPEEFIVVAKVITDPFYKGEYLLPEKTK